MTDPFVLSGFSDEIDTDIEVQLSHLQALGIRYFEPRTINGKSISDLTDAEAAALKARMDYYGISASSIGSPIGKIGISDNFDRHMELLTRTIRTAKILGTSYIRVFSFYIPDGEYTLFRDEVMRRMKVMTNLAAFEDVILLHENEKGIYGDSAIRCREILDETNSKHLRAVFDPANFIQCGQTTYPEAYNLMRPYIEYMHIKDALPSGEVVPAGSGIGFVAEILKSLKASGYEGFLSLEPHLGSFTGLSRLSQDDSRMLQEKEPSSAEKFDIAYHALKSILRQI